MREKPDDPFDLLGKNPRRVIPAVRQNIRIQRARMIGHVISAFVSLIIGILSLRTTGLFLVFGFVCLLMLPFTFIGIYGDYHLMQWHQRRLTECERLLIENTSPK